MQPATLRKCWVTNDQTGLSGIKVEAGDEFSQRMWWNMMNGLGQLEARQNLEFWNRKWGYDCKFEFSVQYSIQFQC